MSKATDKELASLHGSLANVLAEQIASGEYMVNKEGELVLDPSGKPIMKPVPASVLSVARQFLKDNHMEAVGGSKDMGALDQALSDMQNMPFSGEVPAEFRKQ
jgi:hypothetical protein